MLLYEQSIFVLMFNLNLLSTTCHVLLCRYNVEEIEKRNFFHPSSSFSNKGMNTRDETDDGKEGRYYGWMNKEKEKNTDGWMGGKGGESWMEQETIRKTNNGWMEAEKQEKWMEKAKNSVWMERRKNDGLKMTEKRQKTLKNETSASCVQLGGGRRSVGGDGSGGGDEGGGGGGGRKGVCGWSGDDDCGGSGGRRRIGGRIFRGSMKTITKEEEDEEFNERKKEKNRKEEKEREKRMKEGRDGEIGRKEGRDGEIGRKEGRDGKIGGKEGRDGEKGMKEGRDGEIGRKEGRDGKIGGKEGRDGEKGMKEGRDGEIGRKEGRDGEIGRKREEELRGVVNNPLRLKPIGHLKTNEGSKLKKKKTKLEKF